MDRVENKIGKILLNLLPESACGCGIPVCWCQSIVYNQSVQLKEKLVNCLIAWKFITHYFNFLNEIC